MSRVTVLGATGGLGRAITLELAGAHVVVMAANIPYGQWETLLPTLVDHALEGAATAGARLVMVDNLYAYGSPGVPITEATPQAATSRKGRIRRDVGQRLLAAHGPTATTPHAEAVARTVALFRAANASP